jgi:predicted PurR-regulated permease PerM
MLFYSGVAAVYGAICYIFVRFFAFLLFSVTYWFLKLGVLGDNSKLTAIWPGSSFTRLVGPIEDLLSRANWTQYVAIVLIYLCLLAVIGFVVAFIVSFYFSANTIIYSLMRNKVDNTALEDIYTPPDEAEPEPTTTESKPEETQLQPESEAPSDSSP